MPRIDRRRDFALYRRISPLSDFKPGHLGEKGLRIGMVGLIEYRGRRSALHNAAQIHDRDMVAHVFDNTQIVADKQVRKIQVIS